MFGMTSARSLGAVLAVGIAVGLSACGGPPNVVELPPQDTSKLIALHNYEIGPGDSLDIFVWRNPELSARVAVRPDGRVSTPLIEDLEVTRKTPTAVAREIEGILGKYIQDPVVTVLVSGFSGPHTQQVRVVGEVGRPTVITYRENMTALDAVMAAGGLGPFAAGDRSVITRVTDKGYQNIRLKLDQLMKDGDIAANQFLKPGDTIFVPQSFF